MTTAPMLPRRTRRLTECLVLAMVVLAACVTTGAQAQSFQAQNVLVTDYVNSVGRSYTATLQYWAASGQEAILYTVPYSSSTFLIFEDFASGLRYVACDQGCRVESLSSSFPQLGATAASSTRWAYGNFDRTFALPSGSLQTLAARPSLPAQCATSPASLVLTTDPCMPYGLPCGTSCVCLGCTDGDACTADDTCSLTSFGALTCSGAEVCNRTTSGAKTVIALRREEGGGSGTAVALGVALGVGIGVPVGLLLLFLCCVLPLILLPLLWRRRERRPTVVRTTAAPAAAVAVPVAYAPATYMAGPGPTPVAVGNPMYAEPWRTAAMPQGVAGAQGRSADGIVRDIPVYP